MCYVCDVQLKKLLVATIDSWLGLFEENNKQTLPILKMGLVYESGEMEFYPTVQQLEELVLYVVQRISETLQQVPTVASWLSGAQTVVFIDAKVATHIRDAAVIKLRDAVKRLFEEPEAHLQWFSELHVLYIVS